MGKLVLRKPVITINGVDLTNRCSHVTVESTFDDVDVTSFGSIYKETMQGMGDGRMTFSFFQDFAAGSVDATLWPLSQSGDPFPVTVKATEAAVSPTNPLYSMTGVLLGYTPLDGDVGDASTTDVEIPNASQSGLVRAVA